MVSEWSVTINRLWSSLTWRLRQVTSWPSITWLRCTLQEPEWCARVTRLWRWRPDSSYLIHWCGLIIPVSHAGVCVCVCSCLRMCVSAAGGRRGWWMLTAALKRETWTLPWSSICSWLNRATRWRRVTQPSSLTRVSHAANTRGRQSLKHCKADYFLRILAVIFFFLPFFLLCIKKKFLLSAWWSLF